MKHGFDQLQEFGNLVKSALALTFKSVIQSLQMLVKIFQNMPFSHVHFEL